MATRLASALLDWASEHGRHDLPWQNPQTPYRVWISEIMLQQTQVATVLGYFERFMHRFSDIASLANASEDEVMALWAGLGYYARARNMHAAARQIRDDHEGRMPDTLPALQALPGIGRSTAGAILSLAFGEPAALLDGNAKRVYARYFGVAGWPGEARIARRLWAYAEQHTPQQRPGDYAQAIMDLGATLCTRKSPACERCPLSHDCRALAENAVECYPDPRPARHRPLRRSRMLALIHCGQILLHKRPPSGIWGGLWSLPEVPDKQSPERYALTHLGLEMSTARQPPAFRHGFTHFELEIQPIIAAAKPGAHRVNEGESLSWYSLDQLPALPAPVKKFIKGMPRTEIE